MQFQFFMPSRVLFGVGQLDNLHSQALPGTHALIVTSGGNSVIRFGYLQKLQAQLDQAGCCYTVFAGISANPTKQSVMDGAVLAREKGCDFVVGLGGGSSIDAAKAIAVMAKNPGDYWDYIAGGSGKANPVPYDPLPIVAVTTTAGTGTEADPWTVVTNGNEKIGFGYDKTFPVLSVVDPSLMTSVPPHLTAYQGFDALFHSTEGYLHKQASPISDLFALQAITLIGQNLAQAVQDGKNLAARENMALANTYSGIVESLSGCISEHSIEHAMSAFHHALPHGAGLVMVSVAYYSLIARRNCADARMIAMAKALGRKDASSATDFVDALYDLQKQCGVDHLAMQDFQITREELPAIAQNAKDTMGGLFEGDPCQISVTDVTDILNQSYR